MPYNTFAQIFEYFSFRFILGIGLVTNYLAFDEKALIKGAYTVFFMVLGTIFSFIVRRFLTNFFNKKDKDE